MISSELYNPNDQLEKACVWYCFQYYISADQSIHSIVYGRPNFLYFFSEIACVDQGLPVVQSDFNYCVCNYITDGLIAPNDERVDMNFWEF